MPDTEKREVAIKVLPEFGDAYKITLLVPSDRDEEEFIEDWLEDHAINVQDWEFWNKHADYLA